VAVLLVVFIAGAAFLRGLALILAVIGAFLLAAFALFVSRRTVIVPSPAEATQVDRSLKRKAAARSLLEGIADPNQDSHIVYSSHPIAEFVDPHNHVVTWPYAPKEKRVTAFHDAQGIADIQSLLHEVGKERRRIHAYTDLWSDDWYLDAGIFVGSPLANPGTEQVLQRFGCPYGFREVDSATPEGSPAVVPQLIGQGGPWPLDLTHPDGDYGLLAKLRGAPSDSAVFIVAAGIGSFGTRACCRYLHEHVEDLYEEFGSKPFAFIISLKQETPDLVHRVATAEVRDGKWSFMQASEAVS
jgi:hypothetical protein